MKDGHVDNLIEQLLGELAADTSSLSESSREDARKVKNFVDMLPGGFLIYKAHRDEEIIYANKALIRIFKCDSLKDLKVHTGNSFKGIVYHEDLDEIEESIKEQIARSHDDLDYVEYRILCKDGTIRWVEDYGHYVRTSSLGDIFYVFISEATEKINRRNSEKAALIREKNDNEKKYKNIIEEYDKERKLIRQEHLQRLEVIEGLSVNYESILYADLDADKILPYRLSSRLSKQFDKKLQIRGYAWFVGDYSETWVHPDDRELFITALSAPAVRKKLSENRTFYLNFRCVQDGVTKYLQIRLVNSADSEHVSQIVMGIRRMDEEILQEINQKKFLEQALNSAKLATVAKNTFLSNMSHDIRTPLNAILGYTALAKKNINESKVLKKYIDKIESAGKQILELADKVLEISYMETQGFQLTENECNVCDLTREIHAVLLPQAEKKNITFTVDCGNVEHHEVIADKEKLAQAIMQIASNAVKFTRKGGKINLSVQELSSSNEYAAFRFTVEDNGIGIGKESLQRVFEPFEREYNSTASGIFGSGLGLTISKHIIEMMDGKIDVESEVGKGSKFTVNVSMRIKGGERAEAEDGYDSELDDKRILLVEDNEINLEIEKELLEDYGFTVDCAENGKIAVEKIAAAKAGRYAFVLMDIQMPVMDGRTATAEIRKLDTGKDVPIIALSANALESDRRQSLECGMDEHLTKPIDIPAIMKSVAKIIKTGK